MSIVLLAASVLGFVTAGIHIVSGHKNPLMPMLTADFEPGAKRQMHAVWHMVTVILVSTSAALGYLALSSGVDGAGLLAGFIGVNYLAFGGVFVGLAVKLGAREWLLRLPQWTLLLPIGVLACIGAF
jgi:hypothetical protein